MIGDQPDKEVPRKIGLTCKIFRIAEDFQEAEAAAGSKLGFIVL